MKKIFTALFILSQIIFCTTALGFESFVVKSFRIEGLQKVSKDAVLQELPVQSGQQITSANTSEIIKALFKTGFFKDINLSRDDSTLVINVKERPSIAKLEVTGIKSKEEISKILKESNVEAGRFYEPAKLIQAEQEIERHYLMKGRYSVKINSTVTEDTLNRVNITVAIHEGDEARIKSIEIVGNSVFTSKELTKDFLHAPTDWLSWFNKSDRYAKEKLAADLEKLRSYYMDRGYVNFQVDSTQVSLSTDKKDVYITINVSEGDQYRFGEAVKLNGIFVVPREDLLAIINDKIKPNAVFSRQTVWEVKEKLESRVGEDGYSMAQARLNIEHDDQAKSIKIEFYIEPGKRITVRRMEIIGNSLTKDTVLRRGTEQMEGAWISTKSIKEGKEYMLREGFVSQVDVTHKPVAGKDDQVDVQFKVEEQRTAQFSAGIAYSAADKFMYNLSADFRNFLGTGKNVNFSFDNSKTTTSYTLGYFDPYYTSDGIGLGYKVYYNKVNLSKASSLFDYATSSKGGEVNWSLPMSQYDRLILSIGADRTDLSVNDSAIATPREVSAFVNQEGTHFTEYNAAVGWRRNTFDTYIFPTQGMSQRAMFKMSLPNSNLKYYQLEYDVNWFQPITKSYILNLSGEAGYKKNYRSGRYFPFYRNYFAGGADTVRGFEERSLGPRDSLNKPFGGNILALARASIIFPPPFMPDAKSVRTALFLDGGQVYDTNYRNVYDNGGGTPSRNPKGLRYAVGLSLKWNMPLGIPIEFSLAKPLNAHDDDKTQAFSFSFATSFF